MRKIISIDFNKYGRPFLGIGGVTSNGMTKLLREYPEDQRNDILDYLFLPNFGASLQTLKVEIGSDANGTCGTEPSHKRSKDDFDINRGVGLWLAKEAKKRNPDIILDAIRWGTPSWIQTYEDKYDYYLSFLKGAREQYGLEFNYLAPDENEGAYDPEWVSNVLRPGLDRDGFENVILTGADSTEDWNIIPLIKGNDDLFRSIGAVSRHYKQDCPAFAKQCGLPILDSEDLAPFRNKFSYALDVAHNIIHSYAIGRMTQYVMHPVIEAIYDNLPYTCKSILTASEPWSGHYEIEKGLWVVAQFTQFMKPGWHYVDDGCVSDSDFGILTLASENDSEFSIICLNQSGDEKTIVIDLKNTTCEFLSAWKTDEESQFEKLADVPVDNGKLCVTLKAKSICTFTTTCGQEKGLCRNLNPDKDSFLLPYHDDYSAYALNQQPRFTVDQSGAFEVRMFEGKHILEQVLLKSQKPLDWERRPTAEPFTVLGSPDMTNYKVEASVRFDASGYAVLGGRCVLAPQRKGFPECYFAMLTSSGRWFLNCGWRLLSCGFISDFRAEEWHRLSIQFSGNSICASLDSYVLCKVQDDELSSGNVVIGCDYSHVMFSDLLISPVHGFDSSCQRICVLDPKIKRNGSWKENGNNSNNFNRAIIETCSIGDELSFRFEGTSLSICARVDENGGTADVLIDGKHSGVLDCSAEKSGFRRSVFSKYGLNEGNHEVVIKVPPNADGKVVRVSHVEVRRILENGNL